MEEKITNLKFESHFRLYGDGENLNYDDTPHNYEVIADYADSRLLISIDGVEKRVKVVQKGEFYDYIYQIKKTQLNCQTLEKLMKHFKKCIDEDFAITTWCITPLNLIFNNMKPVKF